MCDSATKVVKQQGNCLLISFVALPPYRFNVIIRLVLRDMRRLPTSQNHA